jgi:hypothetical protein
MHAMEAQGVTRVAGGLLRGSWEEGVIAYRGVPFAQPTVGPLRFCSPVPAPPWPGIRDATRPGPASLLRHRGSRAGYRPDDRQIRPRRMSFRMSRSSSATATPRAARVRSTMNAAQCKGVSAKDGI